MIAFLWPVLVLTAVMGWGAVSTRLVRRVSLVVIDATAERLAIGIAVVVSLLGLGAAVDARWVIHLVIGLGLVGASAEVFLGVRAHGWPDRAGWVRILVGSVLLVVLLVYVIATAIDLDWLAYDDPNYLYLAMRLVERGDLIDPGNLRRIQSAGGLTGLQSLFLVQQPTRFLRVADLWLGGVLVLTNLWRRHASTSAETSAAADAAAGAHAGDEPGPVETAGKAGTRWSVVGIVVTVFVLVCVPTVPGMSFNSSPVVLPIGLVMVLFRFLVRLRTAMEPRRTVLALGTSCGLVAGTLMAFRPYLGIPMIGIAGLVALWPPFGRHLVHRVVGMVAGAVIVLAGWGIASWRAAGTLLYPVMAGNTDPSFPTLGHRLEPVTLGGLATKVLGGLTRPLWIVLLSVGLAGLGVAAAQRRNPDPTARRALVVFALALPVFVVWLFGLGLSFWNFGEMSGVFLTRYFVPLVVGLSLVPLMMGLLHPVGGPWRRRLHPAILGVAVCVFVAIVTFDVPDRLGRSWEYVRTGRVVDTDANDRFTFARDEYREASRLLPPGSRVFSAVDNPHLLLGTDITLHTLDLVGFASDTPHLPYFVGDQAKLDWLAAHNYDYLITMRPETSVAMYTKSGAKSNAERPDTVAWARPWGAYIVDWAEFIERLDAQTPERGTVVGNLLVVPLR